VAHAVDPQTGADMGKLQLHNAAAITMFVIRNGMTGSEPFGDRVDTGPQFANRLAAAG
jgi:hypothetical protein